VSKPAKPLTPYEVRLLRLDQRRKGINVETKEERNARLSAHKEKMRRDRVFRAFANAYARVHVLKPDGYTVTEQGYLRPHVDSKTIEWPAMSLQRLKQLTITYNLCSPAEMRD
jgi:hypothetical protein